MDLGGKTIEDFFLGLQGDDVKNQFPCNSDYVGRYRSNADIMYKNVHPLIEKGATIIDGGCLNNHGEKHIKTVIQRATQLIATSDIDLSFYELYVLLMGIHLHDIGNLTGRKEHEEKIGEIITAINTGTASLVFEDEVEKECIEDIAEAHGGDNTKMINLGERETILNHRIKKR